MELICRFYKSMLDSYQDPRDYPTAPILSDGGFLQLRYLEGRS